ncbi:ATP-dependent Clp protease adaptor ClpS [Spirochaetia bacterium 38H-sp]|uniref:ATP-dependent Clp protease adapter protein ClpS n=1 Tax=Rarispira pelagica TaxID=3141764 RepID=A0ABU9UD80_9SPIR
MSMLINKEDTKVFMAFSPDEEASVSVKPKITEPELYWVVMLNDDYTPMDFVVNVLMSVFDKNPLEATELMMTIHNKGSARIASYVYDIAVTKISRVHDEAKKNNFPLRCTMEPA